MDLIDVLPENVERLFHLILFLTLQEQEIIWVFICYFKQIWDWVLVRKLIWFFIRFFKHGFLTIHLIKILHFGVLSSFFVTGFVLKIVFNGLKITFGITWSPTLIIFRLIFKRLPTLTLFSLLKLRVFRLNPRLFRGFLLNRGFRRFRLNRGFRRFPNVFNISKLNF